LAALKLVRDSGYANLAVKTVQARAGLTPTDAAFVTELVFGVCRHMGTIDTVIEMAGGRPLKTLQPAVVDVLRLGSEQLLKMRVPAHACVSSSVSLAQDQIGSRVTGVVNAILRRVAARTWDEWMDEATAGLSPLDALAMRTCHPRWIVDAYAEVLPPDEVSAALEANNVAPTPTLVARPTLMTREELLEAGAQPTQWSPWGARKSGDPAALEQVRDGRAGVQDEGSQIVAELLAGVDAPRGTWLDMCAGPGGKAALLTGLALSRGEGLVAADVHPHRARLVRESLRGYESQPVMVADGRRPPWRPSTFSRILLDAPCTGLGALRRRPEARWRKTEGDLAQLTRLQSELLYVAGKSLVSGGVVAYVTCSPHHDETIAVVSQAEPDLEVVDVRSLSTQVPDSSALQDPRFMQLWPHRHTTDAMFCALLRKR